MASWLISVMLNMKKKRKVTEELSSGSMMKMFLKATEITRAFEYFLATGTLVSRSGTAVQSWR
jgi:hypothetical protein